MSAEERPGRGGLARGACALLAAALAATLVRTAWLCDDGYITLRAVENLVQGRGLTWNPAERVQVNVHPTWTLLLAAVGGATGELQTTAMLTGVALTLAAALALAASLRFGWGAALVLAALVASRSFVDFSTGGLENPLAHLLLALFLGGLAAGAEPVRLALVAGLGVATRPDALLLYGPALALLARGPRGDGARRAGAVLLAAAAPLAAWTAFALVYYGAPFPNPALAKLGTSVPAGELAGAGLHYLANALERDLPTPLLGGAGVALGLAGLAGRGGRAVALGALLQTAWVVKIGGDFMSGRMLTAPFLAGALLAGRALSRAPAGLRPAAAAAALALGLAGARPALLSGPQHGLGERVGEKGDGQGVADERRIYYQATGLLSASRTGAVPDHVWAREGVAARAQGPHVEVRRAVGMFGYFAGPDVHVVDLHALCDPLLARIPRLAAERPEKGGRGWRPGHFRRELPAGYVERLRGAGELADPDLRELDRRVRLLTRGPLFTRARWSAVAGFLTGGGRELVERYLARER